MSESVNFLAPFIRHPEFVRFKNAIRTNQTRLERESYLIFLCGAKSSDVKSSARDTLLRYAQRHLPHLNFFRAEEVFDILSKDSKRDLLSFEDDLALYSDCIVVVLESVGSLVELGAFAVNEKLAEIMLVVNDVQYRHADSFVNHGPIAKLDEKSKFGKTIHANFSSILTVGGELNNRLKGLIRQRRESIDISTYKKFWKARRKIRLLLIADIVSLFSPISRMEIDFILREIYGDVQIKIDDEIAILRGLGLIRWSERQRGFYYRSVKDVHLFIDYKGTSLDQFRATVLGYYRKHSRSRMEALVERSMEAV